MRTFYSLQKPAMARWVGGQERLEEKSEKPLKSFEDPSKYHRSSIEVPS
jgi:hypothetical protein